MAGQGASAELDDTESLSAIAGAAGLATRAAHAAPLKEEIVRDLKAACPVDVVLLQLHGAMVAQGCDNCEADVLASVRAICPEAIIGVTLDCHCHLTKRFCHRPTSSSASRNIRTMLPLIGPKNFLISRIAHMRPNLSYNGTV
ncbi:MAG: M81 family metallopeptidase [Mesorhizobium sp.]|nr:MAG: M81 family metallopeptidase [Mesorhizobium sp.]